MRTTSSLIVITSLFLGACSSAGDVEPSTIADPGSPGRPAANPAVATDVANLESPLPSSYDPAAVRHSYTTNRGDVIDCVDFAAEPPACAPSSRKGRPSRDCYRE